MTNHSWARSLLAAAALLAAGCSDVAAPAAALRSTTYGATLLECPVATATSTSAMIGPAGGSLELNGHRVVIPALAVPALTTFTLSEPASNYVEVDVHAAGVEHYQFTKPVSLTLSYRRCTRANLAKATLRLFYIDGASKQVLEDLGGTDDAANRTVTTSTDHLSGYAIGSN